MLSFMEAQTNSSAEHSNKSFVVNQEILMLLNLRKHNLKIIQCAYVCIYLYSMLFFVSSILYYYYTALIECHISINRKWSKAPHEFEFTVHFSFYNCPFSNNHSSNKFQFQLKWMDCTVHKIRMHNIFQRGNVWENFWTYSMNLVVEL